MAEAQDKIVTNTLSGTVVSIPDALPNYAFQSLEVDLEPIQDLNGYDRPWVGGARTNKYDPSSLNGKTTNGITATVSNGEITLNGTATANAYFTVQNLHLTSADGFSVSANNPVATSGVHFALQTSGGSYFADNPLSNVNTVVKTPRTDCNTFIIYVNSGTALSNFKLKPQLEFGQTATAWEPYSNICPISGHTSVETHRTGRNLLDTSGRTGGTISGVEVTRMSDGTYVLDGTCTANNGYAIFPNAVTHWGGMVLSGCPSGGGSTRYALRAINNGTGASIYDYGSGVTIPTSWDGATVRIIISVYSGQNYDNLTFKPMLRLASDTDSAYEPYQGETYETALGRTVYGGTLDLVSGVLTVDKRYLLIDGSADESIQTSGFRSFVDISEDSITISSQSERTGKLFSDRFSEETNQITYSGGVGFHYRSNGTHQLVFSLGRDELTTVAAWRQWFVDNPTQVVYELATPQTYQLTPQEVEALVWSNVVWSDGGAVSVTYVTESSIVPLKIYAGTTVANMALLPSPVMVKPSNELIWSENTGRAQSGTNKAKMIGDVVAEKITYDIQWGIITQAEYNTIKARLGKGFFYFGIGTSIATAKSSAKKFYRGTITAEMLPLGTIMHYKNVQVQLIEQ